MHAQTRRQREVLDFIVRYIESHGYRPSYQVIARHMGVSSRGGIARIVADLESQGFLQRRRVEGHFAIALTRDEITPANGSVIHWLESSVSGSPGDRTGQPFALPDFLLGGHDPDGLRAFRVGDDGLAENGICLGDIALVELRSFARDGDTIAAIVKKGPVVLRKYYRSGAKIELCCSNQDGNLLLAADRVEIVGLFRGLLRPIA